VTVWRGYYWYVNETKPVFGTNFVRLIAAASFAFMLFMPVSQGELLLVVFGFMVVAATLTCLSTGRALTMPVVAIACVTIFLGLYGLAFGAQNDGFMNAAGIFLGTPLLFFFCISALGQGSIRALLTTGAIMTVVSGIYILVYVGGQRGVLPQVIPANVLELTGAGFGEKGESTSIRFYGLSTLAASGPMWLASLWVRRDAMLPHIALRWAAAAAGVSGALLGGRRAIILTLLVIPVIAWLVKRSTLGKRPGPIRIKPGFMVAGLALSVGAVLGLPRIASTPIIANTWQATVSFFTGSSSDISADESVRTYQAERLLAEWVDSPIWGHGLGATVIGYQRSNAQPWQFEMQYQVFLMQTGLIGLALVVVIATLIWRATRTASKLRPDLIPSLVVTLCGGAAMLIANATNPYLQAPAHHWAIFLPLAVINMMLRTPSPEVKPVEVGAAATKGVTK
jgi:hypothetical protein